MEFTLDLDEFARRTRRLPIPDAVPSETFARTVEEAVDRLVACGDLEQIIAGLQFFDSIRHRMDRCQAFPKRYVPK